MKYCHSLFIATIPYHQAWSELWMPHACTISHDHNLYVFPTYGASIKVHYQIRWKFKPVLYHTWSHNQRGHVLVLVQCSFSALNNWRLNNRNTNGFIRLFKGENTYRNGNTSPASITLVTFRTCAILIGVQLTMYTEMTNYLQ